MSRNYPLAAVGVLAVLLAGCKTDHESVTKDVIGKMKEMTSVLKGVTDETSAKAAAPKLRSISEQMRKLQDEIKKLGEPTPEVKKELATKYEGQVRDVSMEFFKELSRIGMNPKLAGPINDAMKDFSGAPKLH
jgi:hypothetical protein